MLQFISGSVVDLNDFFEGVTKDEVVTGLLTELQVALLKGNIVGCGALSGSFTLACGGSLRRWVDDLLKVQLVLRHDRCGPLSLVLEVVNQLKFVKLIVGGAVEGGLRFSTGLFSN